MSTSVTHIALVVPDLREAEAFYQSVFDMGDWAGRRLEL